MRSQLAQILPDKAEHWSWDKEHARLAAQWNRARRKLEMPDGTLNTNHMASVLGVDIAALEAMLGQKQGAKSEMEAQ